MDEQSSHDPYLSSADEANMVEYRPLCRTAIFALVLGLASALALVSLLLLPIAALAIGMAALALWQIARSEAALVGRWAAMLGLFLAILFTSAAVAKTASRNWLLRQHAQELGDQWVQLVREGELYRAHQLHLPAYRRQLSGSSLNAYYERSEVAQEEYADFYSGGPISALAEAGETGQVQFEGIVRHDEIKTQDAVVLHYRLQLEDQAGVIDFHLPMIRLSRDNDPRWRVGRPTAPTP